MPIVDSHCHAALSWYEPVESLLRQMDANAVEKAVLIQMMGQYDNEYQAASVRRHADRLASVVLVDLERSDATDQLEKEADRGAVGVRLRPGSRSRGDDPLAIWRVAERRGLAVSVGGSSVDFASPQFANLVADVPGLKIVIEHLGSMNRPDDDRNVALRRRVFGLSRYPNVYIKFHGLGEFAPRAMPVTEPFPFAKPIPRTLRLAYDAFGARRMMWGSDYPPVAGREGYRNALRLPLSELADLSDDERALAFGGVAMSVFPI